MNAPARQRYTKQYIDELLERTDLVGLISGRGVKLKKQGSEWQGICPFHNEKSPSFTVRPDRGFYHCFGCSEHGDAIGFLKKIENLTFLQAVEVLAGHANLPAATPQTLPAKTDDEEELRRKLSKIKFAQTLWREAQPIRGTVAEKYMRGRGINIALPPTLRFHPHLPHHPSGKEYPAMLGFIQGADGKFCGVHRTYLQADGIKAPLDDEKKMLGSWGHVRFAEAAEHLAIAEGIETALSVMQACPGLPVWSAMALGNLHASVPDCVKRVTMLADADNKDQAKAERLMQDAAVKLAAPGRDVRWCFPPAGMDFNDLLRRQA